MEGQPPFHQIIYILNFSYKKTTSVKHCCRSLNNTWLVKLKMFRLIFFSLKVYFIPSLHSGHFHFLEKYWMKPILEALAICLPDHSLYMYDRTTSKIQWWTSSAQALTQGRSLKAFERAFLNLMKYIMKSLSIWVNSTVLLGVLHNIYSSQNQILKTQAFCLDNETVKDCRDHYTLAKN